MRLRFTPSSAVPEDARLIGCSTAASTEIVKLLPAGERVTTSRVAHPADSLFADVPVRSRSVRARRFLLDVSTRLARSDDDALIAYLEAEWSPADIVELLLCDQDDHQPDIDLVKTAAICLGLVGAMAETPALARTLHHDDYFVVNIAERALWNIWFRASDANCCNLLKDAIAAMHDDRSAEAERILDRILMLDPDFAEACNQRAILHYLTGRYPSSLMACRRTLALNPHHFGAAAGLGHNHMQLRQYADAAQAYHRALRIHPRMEGVRQQLRRAKEANPTLDQHLTWRRPT